MPDPNEPIKPRSAGDKERSRQQSRPVSGKEAAKGVQGKPGQGKAGQGKASASQGSAQAGKAQPPGRGGSGASRPAAAKTGGQRPPRSGSRPVPSGPRRSPTALLTWGLVGLVLVIVIVLVVVKVTSSSTGTGAVYKAQPVTATIANEVTAVPSSVYNTVGVTSSATPVTPPTLKSGQAALTLDGKPGVFYMGGEFCPYCAAERWGIITSLSRFGKFTGLETMQSASDDVYPNTATFTLAHATYTSPYITFQFREYYSNQTNSAGTYIVLQKLDTQQESLVSKYDGGGSSTSSGGSIPFVDIGNKAIVTGASYSPEILQSLARSQIAGALSDPSDPVTQAIIATSNYISASICSIDGGKPGSVCASKGVQAAAKAMKLTT
ncbi:MAG: DUF929 family protein [Actinomycetota bacterium]|nr:DUF929 family protein [Actinomycetota bacterium]